MCSMSNLDAEIERLKSELEQERSMRDNLEKSTLDLENDTNKLAITLVDDCDDLDNEWRQKYEGQYEINTQLKNQLGSMNEKIKELSKLDDNETNSKHTSKLNDTDLRIMLRQLEREKRHLEGNLKDLEWKLDSVSQNFFKVNEEKKKYKLELNQAAMAMDEARSPSSFKSAVPGLKFSTKRSEHSLKNRHYGIPDNHRIIDARKGPVNRIAAAKTLPKLPATTSTELKENHRFENKKRDRKTKSSEEQSKTKSQVIETNGFETS